MFKIAYDYYLLLSYVIFFLQNRHNLNKTITFISSDNEINNNFDNFI